MAEIITITNQKGGVGKTTTASALICGLTQRGARVLGVDLDPQGNLGFTMGLDIGNCVTIYEVLKGTTPITRAISRTEYGDILPADIMLSTAELEFVSDERKFMLRNQLSRIENLYDFIVIDTPPALNILTENAYVAAQHLIIPMEAEVLSLVGVTQLQETIEAVRESFNPNLKVMGILLNKYNARLRLSGEILELAEEVARQLNTKVFQIKVRRGVDVAIAPAHGQSVVTYAPKSKPAMDLQEIVSLVADRHFPAAKRGG